MSDIRIVALPHSAPTTLTFNGVPFDPSADVWRIPGAERNHLIRFDGFVGADPQLIPSLKGTLSWYAQNRSSSHLRTIVERLRHFFRTMSEESAAHISLITDDLLKSYRICLPERQRWYLSALAGAVKRWHGLGYAGVDASAIRFLGVTRLKGVEKGTAVRTLDPIKGAFTDVEFEAIHAELALARTSGALPRPEYLITWLLMLLGVRPIQVSLLKAKDVQCVRQGAAEAYWLMVPRAKQRMTRTRTKFRRRPLPRKFGEALLQHAAAMRREFESLRALGAEAPLFPADEPTESFEPGLEWHQTSRQLSLAVIGALAAIAPHSERTGRRLVMTPQRFRRTLGTRMAMEGHGDREIADALDHSDTQNVGCYREARPEILQRISKAIAMRMGPLARAFKGEIENAQDPSAVKIPDLVADASTPACIGSCASGGGCGSPAPVSCYTCSAFRPWVYGRHQEVLDRLLRERARLMKTADARIASIHDRTVCAIAEVIEACEERRQELGDRAP